MRVARQRISLRLPVVREIPTHGTDQGRQQLSDCLHNVGLTCVTEEDFVETGKLTTKSSVDHLCLDGELADGITSVDAWEADLLNGKPISDHNGVVVEVDM